MKKGIFRLYRKDGGSWYKTNMFGTWDRVAHFGSLHLQRGIKVMIKKD